MPHTVELSDDFRMVTQRAAELCSRSVPKQIEFWSRIGKLVEENPDLPLDLIREIQRSRLEADAGGLSAYEFG